MSVRALRAAIFIESRVFSGAGELRALGGNGIGGGTAGGGGGGRIAVWGALSQWQGSPSIALTAEDYALSVTNGTSYASVPYLTCLLGLRVRATITVHEAESASTPLVFRNRRPSSSTALAMPDTRYGKTHTV